MIRVMLRRIYCYVLTQRMIGNWDAHSQGSVKHQLPIVAVIASGQLLQGVYLRTIGIGVRSLGQESCICGDGKVDLLPTVILGLA